MGWSSARRGLVVVAVALVLGAGACGSDDEGESRAAGEFSVPAFDAIQPGESADAVEDALGSADVTVDGPQGPILAWCEHQTSYEVAFAGDEVISALTQPANTSPCDDPGP